jgi:hypothetical protein
MNTKQSTQNVITVSQVVLTLDGGLNGEPCFFGNRQGITSCTRCRVKLVCKKSPEVKQSYECCVDKKRELEQKEVSQ